jgi:DNA-binding GntR family transcriptional regulator
MPVPDKVDAIPRSSARAQVFDVLREWIEDGTLAPGEVIKDVDLARRLGVSRTPVREAFQMLEQLGAIETSPSRHTRVAEVRPEDAGLVYPPLAALQAYAAEVTTATVTEEDLAEMTAANDRVQAAVRAGDPVAAREADLAFHRIVVERAENPYLENAVSSLLLHTRRLDALYFTHLGPSQESFVEHEAIIDAMRRRDATQAAEITRRNFLRTVAVFLDDHADG